MSLRNLLKVALPQAYQNSETFARSPTSWGEKPARSVLLVGPSGVGRRRQSTNGARRKDHNLGATPFFATSGSRLVAGQTGYGVGARCRDLCRRPARRQAVRTWEPGRTDGRR